MAAELAERLREALTRIPENHARVFVLHALEGLDYAEIASHLNASVDAVGVWLHRARNRLRILLAESSTPISRSTGSREEQA